MGGPGGVTGQPSTWITQLVAGLLGQTEDRERLVFLAGAHARFFMHEITIRSEHAVSFRAWLHSCTSGSVQICGLGAAGTHDSLLDRISGVVSQ